MEPVELYGVEKVIVSNEEIVLHMKPYEVKVFATGNKWKTQRTNGLNYKGRQENDIMEISVQKIAILTICFIFGLLQCSDPKKEDKIPEDIIWPENIQVVLDNTKPGQ